MANRNLSYPFHFDSRGRTATTDDNKHIQEMLEELLFTNPGERINRPDFGSGLQQLVFAANSPEVAAALQFTLQAAIQLWLGDLIVLKGLEVTNDDSILTVFVSYVVQRTNEQQVAQFTQTV